MMPCATFLLQQYIGIICKTSFARLFKKKVTCKMVTQTNIYTRNVSCNMITIVAVAANKNFLVVPIIVEVFQSALSLMCRVRSSDRLDPPW